MGLDATCVHHSKLAPGIIAGSRESTQIASAYFLKLKKLLFLKTKSKFFPRGSLDYSVASKCKYTQYLHNLFLKWVLRDLAIHTAPSFSSFFLKFRWGKTICSVGHTSFSMHGSWKKIYQYVFNSKQHRLVSSSERLSFSIFCDGVTEDWDFLVVPLPTFPMSKATLTTTLCLSSVQCSVSHTATGLIIFRTQLWN